MRESSAAQDLELILNDVDYNFADHYVYRSKLGQGAFGVVVEAISKKTLETMAVKVGMQD